MNRLQRIASESVVVLLLGMVSTTTAWTAIQASFHGSASSAAYGDYQLIIADANNLWITAEVKYRADLLTWDTGIGGSYEFDVHAKPCIAAGSAQLPDCAAYMDAVYGPYNQMYDSGAEPLAVSEQEGNYSSRLQMLTGLFALALFALGVTSPIKNRQVAACLVLFSAGLWLVGLSFLLSLPVLLV